MLVLLHEVVPGRLVGFPIEPKLIKSCLSFIRKLVLLVPLITNPDPELALRYRAVSRGASASPYESGGQEFESLRAGR